MTRIYGDPARFKDDVLDGFERAYSRYVTRVAGASGFVRASGPLAGKVSLVVGGGSGHYPSYAGIVGSGFADGCVLGDVFTSPSAEQVYRVAKAADGGAGVVLAFGNYAGDRLNFGVAQQRLQREGVDTRVVYVTDDIASAAPSDPGSRRGIAGTFVAYKVGGASADRGDSLDDVETLMRVANQRTFSFGVAFAGCTLPGRPEPLFRVAQGRMEFGLGIHGEPGVRDAAEMRAAELAAALVEAVLAEHPPDARPEAAVVVNGLGATKYEELFVLYGSIHRLLLEAGVKPVLPEVGELVTSLDMAGCSLSVTWLTEELESCWTAPADTAAFRRGEPVALPYQPSAAAAAAVAEHATRRDHAAASQQSQAAAALARSALHAIFNVVVQQEEELGRLDAVAGDGDHGSGMVRGLRAATAAADVAEGGLRDVLTAAGAAFADAAGGTSGMLWGQLLDAAGDVFGNSDAATPKRVRDAVLAAADAVQSAGHAQPGDKTMLDALLPFADMLARRLASGDRLDDAWRAAADVAAAAALDTARLVPKVGRARPLAERSIGTPDPGATSIVLALAAVAGVLAEHPCPTVADGVKQ